MDLPSALEIKEVFNKWCTEYLISIWLTIDRNEYRDEAFQALKEILSQRGVILTSPGKTVRYNGQLFNPPKIDHLSDHRQNLNLPPIDNPETLVTVDTCYNGIEADLMKSRLEAEGINVFLLGEYHVQLLWLHSNAIGGIKIQVKESDAKQARSLIKLLKESQLRIESEEEMVQCPNCGSSDIRLKKKAWRIAFLTFFLCQIPLPFRKNIAVCNSCGHKWKNFEKIKSVAKPKLGRNEEWVCSNCEAVVTEDAKVCPKCGADVSDIEED